MNKTSTKAVAASEDNLISPVDLPDSPLKWVKRTVYGALVGVGAILPGVSGGAFCAAFGIYRPLMDFIAHPGRKFKKNLLFFTPFLIGCAIGFFALARLVNLLLGLEGLTPIVTAFFVGCVAGTLPSLLGEANVRKWKPLHFVLLTAASGLAAWGLTSMEKVSDMQALIADPSSLSYLITWIVCGAIFTLGFIMPGMSPSSILLYAGLYEPMTGAFWPIDLSVVLPFLLGAGLCVVLLTKLVSSLFVRAGRSMFAVIIGVVVASTVLLLHKEVWQPIAADFTAGSCLWACAAGVAGLVLVLLLARLDPRSEENVAVTASAEPTADEPAAEETEAAEAAEEDEEESHSEAE